MRRLLACLVAGVLVTLAACEVTQPAAQARAASPARSGTIVNAVYLFNSDACPCEKDRNAAAEEVMKAVTKRGLPATSLTRVDVHKEPKELDRFEKAAGITFLPVLLGIDSAGAVVKKIEGYFKEAQVAEILLAP
jgi:hypothetical protein